ncbi:hypothetical protein L9F63_004739 [Diploptera punctata]|uniref:Ribosomal protein eL8/eL30/eS12/Gadd45 domain-containing protein n=1 Tax=Diploptera punctata TaxID=6984 RepID=A0AAD8E7G0_DIPPU|nr:hypothetical protein L9F63_004739 [Diploptera punctata]
MKASTEKNSSWSELSKTKHYNSSWPELPGSSVTNEKNRSEKSKMKFSHVVKEEKKYLNDVSQSETQDREFVESSDKISTNIQSQISAKPGKELSQKVRHEGKIKVAKSEKQLLKDNKKRAKEEEIRKNLIAPKGQKIQIVDQKMLEGLLNNSVSFVNQQTLNPALTDTEFPSFEEARKQRVKKTDYNTEQEHNKNATVIKRIKKRKDPVHIDLVNLIKETHKKPPLSAGRVQKRNASTSSYFGNQLDASNPQRKRGKMREVPKRKKLTSLKCAILENRALRRRLMDITSAVENLSIKNKQPLQLPIHSRKFREYCDNRITLCLNVAMKQLLRDLVKFQDRQYQKNAVKAFAKRRYVSGFREVKKQLGLNKVKLVVIAPDLEIAKNKGGIDETVADLKAVAKEHNVMCAFALSRRELGFLTYKKVGISCIGICNYEGSETNYQEVLRALAEAQEKYQLEISSISENPPDATNEVITSLLSKFSVSESPFLNAIENKFTSEEER